MESFETGFFRERCSWIINYRKRLEHPHLPLVERNRLTARVSQMFRDMKRFQEQLPKEKFTAAIMPIKAKYEEALQISP